MKRIVVLGATGSVGRQTLDIVRQHPERLRVVGLSAGRNTELLEGQLAEFGPEHFAIADERAVPPFVVFGDLTLREMTRLRPISLEALRAVKGVGERKLSDFGDRFLARIAQYAGSESPGRYSEAV